MPDQREMLLAPASVEAHRASAPDADRVKMIEARIKEINARQNEIMDEWETLGEEKRELKKDLERRPRRG